MPQLVLLRHGQSVWNRDDRFTGWTDVDLTPQGVEEAHRAAALLAGHDLGIDVCFTSLLTRAIRTLWVVLDDMRAMWLPVERHWRLNERHYGALQGLNKAEMREKAGAEQVHAWRRGFAVRPPALDEENETWPGYDRRYAGVPKAQLPRTESLADTVARVLPYWFMRIEPALMQGSTPLVVAHGNSLRGLIKHLDGIPDDDISGLEIPTGAPLLYEFDDSLKPRRSRYLD
ncbi:MAG: 2,3-diphosphoglycerate-dependent phosphoglycerate mutase [Geminicoccaceae bacterium]|nr:2,3-diphosphoglycerate-dependent phosphoglycerate mutase [Geminicoccaceae bacterium]